MATRSPYRISSVVTGSPVSVVTGADEVRHGANDFPVNAGNQVFVLKVDGHGAAQPGVDAVDGQGAAREPRGGAPVNVPPPCR